MVRGPWLTHRKRLSARARKLLNPKFRIAETIEFKSATTPDGAPIQPTSAPPV